MKTINAVFSNCLFLLLVFSVISCSNRSSDQEQIIDRIKDYQVRAKADLNDSTLIYLKESRRLMDSLGLSLDSLAIENVFIKGFYFRRIQQLDSASIYLHKAIDMIKDTSQMSRTLVYFRNTWDNDIILRENANAISAADRYLELYEGSSNYKDMLYAHNVYERVELNLGNLDKALVHNEKVQEYAIKARDTFNSAITNYFRAKYYFYGNEKEKAFKLLDSLVIVSENMPDDLNRQLFLEYAILDYYNDNIPEAVNKYKRALTYAIRDSLNENHNTNVGWLYSNIADGELALGNYEEAEKSLDEGAKYVNKSFDKELISAFGQNRLILNSKSGAPIEALIKDFDELVLNQTNAYEERMNEELFALTTANEQQRILESEKQQAEIDSLKSQSRLYIFLGIFLLLLAIGYFLYLRRKQKFERQGFYMQQRLLRSQMSPHFTFNALYAIQNKVKDDPKEASNYLLKFSRLLRVILENSTHNYVQLETELQSLKSYLDLQLLRFPGLFKYNLNLQGMEEDEFIFIPPMLMQPFVENSIIHGFSNIDYEGQLDINLRLENNYIECTIEDNGRGLTGANKSESKSLSGKLISDFLKKATGSGIEIINKVDVNSSKSGVKVMYKIPFKLTEDD